MLADHQAKFRLINLLSYQIRGILLNLTALQTLSSKYGIHPRFDIFIERMLASC